MIYPNLLDQIMIPVLPYQTYEEINGDVTVCS